MNFVQPLVKNPILRYSAIMIIPLLLFFLPLALKTYYGPCFLGYNSDIDYGYLLNSLNIINLIPPKHTDHPGTTVQLLGSIGLMFKWISHLASGGHLGVTEYVLRYPEESLGAINFLINILVFLAFVFASLSIYRTTQSAVTVFIFQLSLSLPLQVKISLFTVSPEPLLVFSVLVLSGLLIRYQPSDSISQSWFKIPILVGIIMGFGLQTKVTFLPILLMVVLFPTKKEKLLVILGSTITFLLFSLPIFRHWRRMLSWFFNIATHSGHYGEGDIGIPATTELMFNLLEIIRNEPALFICLACICVYLVVNKFMVKQIAADGTNRLLFLGAGAIIIQVMLTMKHFGMHYMVPALTMTALLNVKLFTSLTQYRGISNTRLGKGFVYTVVLAGLAYGISSTKSWAIESKKYYNEEIVRSNQLNTMSNCTVIGHYRSSSVEYALAFGNEWAGFKYGNELTKIYPDMLFYNIWNGNFYNYKGVVSKNIINNMLANRSILMVGMPLKGNMSRKLGLTTLESSQRVAVYKLECIAVW